ncbi:MAG: YihY family inner membrane protein [Rhodospirillaceae bacterium]
MTDDLPETTKFEATKSEAAGAMMWRWAGEFQRFVVHLLQRLVRDDLFGVAAALTYTSLLALVPLIAIAVAILAAFPVFDQVRDQLQSFLFENFLPDVGLAVQDHLARFVGATGQLTAVGVGGLAITALMMLMTIEQAFNTIFRVTRARSMMGRLLVYWTVLTLGPLLIGVSFSISSYLAAAGEDILTTQAVSLWTKVSWVMPYILTLIAFMLLYWTVPNRRVRVRDALIGAFVGATLFALLRYAFLLFVANAGSYETVYGALAALPMFLLWMYISWLVVLFGAVITAALPEWRMRRGQRLSGGEAEARLALAMDIMAALGRTQRFGRGLARARLLSLTAAAEDVLVSVLDCLRTANLVAQTADGWWLLTRPLSAITLYDLLRVLGSGVPDDPPVLRNERWAEPVRLALARSRRAQREILGMSLDTLVLPHPEVPHTPDVTPYQTRTVGE